MLLVNGCGIIKNLQETYDKLMIALTNVDLSQIIETEDETDLKGELACAGGSCEIT